MGRSRAFRGGRASRFGLERLLRALRGWLAPALLALGPPPLHAATDCPPVARAPSAEQVRANLQAARDRGFLWRIRKEGRTSYLYGTIHVGKAEWAFPGPRVREALMATQALALELDLTDPQVLAQLSRTLRPDPSAAGERFQLPAAAQKRLAKQAELACIGPEVLSGQHPVMQAMTLTVMAGRHDGLHAAFAQEIALGGLARAVDKPIVSLETAQAQAALLMPTDARQALAMVEQSLAQLEKGQAREMLVRVARLWEDSDLDQLSRYEQWCACVDTDEDRQYMRRVNDDRNGPMAARIDALHAAGRTVFAAVGSLHMTGAQGLPVLMQQRGYQVERIAFEGR